MIWSDCCIDESAGFDKQEDGTLRPRKLGRMVLTTEEAWKIINDKNIFKD